MKNVANFLLFQAFWLAAVGGAARGWPWLGPAAVVAFLFVHLKMIPEPGERLRELRYVLIAGVIGTLLDTGLRTAGIIVYPSSQAWSLAIAPPFVTSLWIAFALLPRFSLAWLSGRPLASFALGAIGGVLSFYAGTRFGVVGPGESAALTWGTLALEYALVTPLLLYLAPDSKRSDGSKIRVRPRPAGA